jgi:hypothetical protein
LILSEIQPSQEVGFHTTLLRSGTWVMLLAGLLGTGLLLRRRSLMSTLAAEATSSLALSSAWFRLVGATRPAVHALAIFVMVVYLPFALLTAWIALRAYRSRAGPWQVPPWMGLACFVATVLVIPFFFASLHLASEVVRLHRMRLAWIGFDVFELSGLVATGLAIFKHSPRLALAAGVTGSLLFCDAWFNIISTDGLRLVVALLMGLVEIPLGLYSIWIASQEIRSWSPAAHQALDAASSAP